MPTGFSDLPYELRLQIFEFVAEDECQPRVVEIYRKGDQLYSKAAPPPLLHVCRESRDVLLKIYKPWLPQFKGTAIYKPWGKVIQQHLGRPQFSLDNVYVNLEYDTLLIRDERTLWRLGSLECDYLRHLGINVAGGLRPSQLLNKLRILKRLEYLYIFDARNSAAEDYKADYLRLQAAYEEELDRERPKKKKTPDYVAPKVVIKGYPPPPTSWGTRRPWTSYKYLKKEELLQIALTLGRRPPKSPEMSRTRRRQILPENAEEERPRKRTQLAPKPAPKPAVNVPSRARNPPYRKPVPSILRPAPVTKPDPEPASVHSSPSITTDDEIQIQLQLREELDHVVDGDTNAEGDPSTSNEEVSPEPNASESPGGDSEAEVYVVEKFLAERQTPQGLEILVQWEGYPNEEDFTWEQAKSLAESVPHMLEEWNGREKSADADGEEVYVVEKFLAERQTPQGLEILVQWEGYPNEEDFTWEQAKSLAESVPNMLEEWNEKEENLGAEGEEENDACQIAEAEKILTRRKFNGVPHYLVKWVGYEKVEDRTWEPCERLRVDTPFIVEEYEQKSKGRRKR
jgi:hypothetical protein